MRIRPVMDRIIVRRVAAEETSKGGIIIPDTAKEKPSVGIVAAVGEGKEIKVKTPDGQAFNGGFRPLVVKQGETVYFARHMGLDAKIDGVEYVILKEEDILLVLDEAEAGDGAVAKVFEDVRPEPIIEETHPLAMGG